MNRVDAGISGLLFFIMELTKHENTVLLSLYRKYTTNEEWSFIIRVCKEQGIEIGKLKSEIDHLTHELQSITPTIVEKYIEVIKEVNPEKIKIEEIINQLGFDDNSISEMTHELLDVAELKVLKHIGEYGKKTWMLGYLHSCIKQRRTALNRNKKTVNDFIVDILRGNMSADGFIDLIKEAKELREEYLR